MLETLGVESLDALVDATVPESIRLRRPLEIPERPGMRTVMSPIQVSGQSKVPPRRAPELGEHTREVLRSVGYDDAALQRLRAAGALG